MMRAIRSALFLATGFLVIVAFAIVALFFFWAPQKFLWGFVVTYCKFMLWVGDVLCGMKVVVEGKEHLPEKPSVIMIKHTTTLETYGHVPFFPRTAWVLKREIIWMPVFGWVIGLLFRPIAIRRSARSAAVKQVIQQGKEKAGERYLGNDLPRGDAHAAGRNPPLRRLGRGTGAGGKRVDRAGCTQRW